MIASLRGPDFRISAHGRGNAYISFCLLVYRKKKQTNKLTKKKQLSSSLQLAPSWSQTALNGIVHFIIVTK